MKTNQILIPLTAILAFSCHSNKENITIEHHTYFPENWTSELQSITGTENQESWANDFNSSILVELIELSNQNNPELNSIYQRIVAQGEDITMVGAMLLPSSNANLSGTKSKRNLIGFNFPNSETSFTSENFSSGLNISWELDFWGKIKNSKQSSTKSFEASISDFESARLSHNGQVAKSWFNLLGNNQQIKLIKKTINTYLQNLDFINNRFEKGLATALEQKLAEASYKSSKANLAQLNRLKSFHTNNLKVLIGCSPDYEIKFKSTNLITDLKIPNLPPTPSEVINSRHDVKAAIHKIDSAGFDLKIAKKNLLPSFTLTGSPGSRSDNFKNLVNQKFRVWDISGGLSQPIFQGGRLKAGVRKAQALQNAALQNYKSIALRAYYEIESTLLIDSQFAVEEKNLNEASIALARAADLSWERYQKGLEGIFDTLETRRRAFNAESSFLNIKKERILNRINFYIAIGMNAVTPKS